MSEGLTEQMQHMWLSMWKQQYKYCVVKCIYFCDIREHLIDILVFIYKGTDYTAGP